MSRRARQIRQHRAEAAKKKETLTNAVTPKSTPQEEVEVEVSLEVKVEVEITLEPEIAEVLTQVQADGVVAEEEEDQLRQLAKSKGISHWWSKSIDRIQSELAELEG